jgi:hypothetical protein
MDGTVSVIDAASDAAGGYAERLQRYRRGVKGDPDAIDEMSRLVYVWAQEDEAEAWEFRNNVHLARKSWLGRGSTAFGEKSEVISNGIVEMARVRRDGASALRTAAQAHRQALSQMDDVLGAFHHNVAVGSAHRNDLIAGIPSDWPAPIAWAQVKVADWGLANHVKRAGRAALRDAEDIDRQLNEVLESCATTLRESVPVGGLSGTGYDYRGTAPLDITGDSYALDPALAAHLGLRDYKEWELERKLEIPKTTWSQAALGVPASWAVPVFAFGDGKLISLARPPGNLANDLSNFAFFDPNVNNVRLFEDPVVNRFVTGGVKAGVGAGFDQLLNGLGAARWGSGEGVPRLDSQLKPGTLMTITGGIDLGMYMIDTHGPDPESSNSAWALDRALRGGVIGLGVGLPTGIEKKDWKTFAFSAGIPATQYFAGQWFFSKPPDPSANWYDLGGARPWVVDQVGKVGDLDYWARTGESAGAGNTSNLVKSLVNPTAGLLAETGDATVNALDAVDPVSELIDYATDRDSEDAGSASPDSAMMKFAGRSYTRAENGLYYAINEVPDGPVDTATAATLNGFQALRRYLGGDDDGAALSWRRARLDSTAYGTEPEQD